MGKRVALAVLLLGAVGAAVVGVVVLNGRSSHPRPDSEALGRTLLDGTLDERRHAAITLSEWAGHIPVPVPALVRGLDDEDEVVIWGCVRALGRVGAEGSVAVPRLAQLLEHSPAEDTRRRTARALADIGAQPELVVPLLMRSIEEGRLDAQDGLRALTKFGPNAAPSVRLVTGYLGTECEWAAMQALGSIGQAAKPAVPQLVRVLRDRAHEEKYLQDCAKVLGEIGPVALPDLLDQVQRGPNGYLLNAIGWMGPQAAEATPTLLAILNATPRADQEVQERAAWALGRIQLHSAAIAQALDAAAARGVENASWAREQLGGDK